MNNVNKESQEKIAQLQILEENMQQYSITRQNINAQILEIDAAIKELENKDKAYKIVGTIMIEKSSQDLKKDLEDKKKILELRITSVDKQEEKLKTKFMDLQKEVMEELN